MKKLSLLIVLAAGAFGIFSFVNDGDDGSVKKMPSVELEDMDGNSINLLPHQEPYLTKHPIPEIIRPPKKK